MSSITLLLRIGATGHRSRPPRRVLAAALRTGALLLAVLAASQPPAAARATPGPPYLATGFTDDNVFLVPPADVRAVWFARARRIGSSWVRIGVYWKLIAPASPRPGFDASDPADPQYDFTALDGSIRAAAAAHQKILVNFFHPPDWAQGPNRPANAYPDSWRPSARALGAFARAVARRYSGRFPDPMQPGHALPRVGYFQAWNEPNLPGAISPQWVRGRHGRWVPASPAIYRRMLNAVYANVKAVQPHAYVLSAGTAPYGDPPGGQRMAPLLFMRELLCLHGPHLRRERCPVRARFDAIDHHPYGLTPSIPARNPGDISVPDMWKLTRVLRAAARLHTVLPRGRKALWMTELDWTSHPPDPYGIPLGLQARYLALSFYELWRQGIGHVFWFLLRDAPYKSLTGAGVYFGDGTAKPSTLAFRFPFTVVPISHGRSAVWGRAPSRGVVSVEHLVHGSWRRLGRFRTTAGGVFYAVRQAHRGEVLRAGIAGVTSLTWTVG